MYDDLLGPKKYTVEDYPVANEKSPVANEKSTKDAEGHGSVSSCSEGSSSVCNSDCVDCEDDCDGESQEEAPTPKDPWADVTSDPKPDPNPNPKPDPIHRDPIAPIDDEDEFGWLEDDCEGDCDNCADDECSSAEGSWVK